MSLSQAGEHRQWMFEISNLTFSRRKLKIKLGPRHPARADAREGEPDGRHDGAHHLPRSEAARPEGEGLLGELRRPPDEGRRSPLAGHSSPA